MSKLVAEYNGQTKSLYEWSKVTGIAYKTLCNRYMDGDRGEDLFRRTTKAICKICGKEFATQSSLANCCSEECKIENNRINSRNRKQRLRNMVKPQAKKYTLNELAKMSKEVGMSYGYYTGINKL